MSIRFQSQRYFHVLHAAARSSPKGFGEKSSSFPSFTIRASVFIRQNLAQLNITLFKAPETRTLLTGSDTA